ncbi:unnamed protein product [Bursaphelenchus xylophilus]|uniref:(pine wood nematode) hypothetical protein n=1 Tax=Bursaphelenchus xylophilus TaxID=6326 RepID=A0A1I7RHY8_BURXY|nr:unnamed protein product [Bursaphelenchus xylophilus]CAG9115281.1 unnamed protein product [Bursaphelenchus xylophilus]
MHVFNVNEKLQVMVVDLNGLVRWRGNDVVIDLKSIVTEPKMQDHTLELVSSDAYPLTTGSDTDPIAYLGTCWVVYDQLFAPHSFFAALFQVNKDYQVSQWMRITLPDAPTFTKFIASNPTAPDNLYWSIFSHSKGADLFEINRNVKVPFNKRIAGPRSVVDNFRALDISDLPGSVLRCDTWASNSIRVVVAGFDTGYVIASISPINTNTVSDRKTLKFSGPISILQVVQPQSATSPAMVLVSSTIGPATIWALRIEKNKIFWELRTQFTESEVYDAVITATTTKQFILIGTYGEQLLIYSLEDSLRYSEISPLATLNVASPILSIVPVENDNALFVLSSKGFHQYVQLDSAQQPMGNIEEGLSSTFESSPKNSQILKPPIV